MSRRFRPLVLCYHAVSNGWSDELSVSPDAFARQLRSCLARRYRPASAEEVASGEGRLLHVTFDDAFRSLANAVPILTRLRVPATVFACSAYAEDGRPLAVPELADEARAQPAELATMPWGELRALAQEGIEIASHTVTHAHLTRLSDGELDRELRESRERIEAEIGRACRFLAYPYGEEDARVHAAARAAGYEAAFALPGRDAPVNRFALPRVGVWRRDGLLRATAKTSAALRPSGRLTWLLRAGASRRASP